MCTLTYLPLGENLFILTSNRDESPNRKQALPPVEKIINGQKVICPVDGLAGGAWIALSENKRAACLLNGGTGQHEYLPPYRLSRGTMVLESFESESTESFFNKYNFEGIEPFTFVGLEAKATIEIKEMKWDGCKTHLREYDGRVPHIWSAPQLYKPEVSVKREQWFRQWLEEGHGFTLENIRKFHRFGGEGDIYNDIRMNREEKVKTVSITSVEHTNGLITMHYEDLLSNEVHSIRLMPGPARIP